MRNLLFTVLQPGIVAGVVPYLILARRGIIPFDRTSAGVQQYGAAGMFVLGLAIMLWCIISFAIHGRGTLSPADPTERLVIRGLYHYSRNPMYVGVMLMLVAESLFFGSVPLWLYSLAVFILFNLFVRYFEEPRLQRDFGGEYVRYRKRVRMWF